MASPIGSSGSGALSEQRQIHDSRESQTHENVKKIYAMVREKLGCLPGEKINPATLADVQVSEIGNLPLSEIGKMTALVFDIFKFEGKCSEDIAAKETSSFMDKHCPDLETMNSIGKQAIIGKVFSRLDDLMLYKG